MNVRPSTTPAAGRLESYDLDWIGGIHLVNFRRVVPSNGSRVQPGGVEHHALHVPESGTLYESSGRGQIPEVRLGKLRRVVVDVSF